MNDRFRLRAYVKANEEVEMVEGINYEAWEVDNKPLFIVGGVGRTEDEIVLMQCTGLKDKNGKLIYEGDIVKYAEFDWTDFSLKDLTAEVVYGVDYDNYYPAFDLKDKDFDGTNAFAYLFNEGWTVEVIGNKFENPELLKECENE